MSTTTEMLLALPEPVVLATHKSPDADGLSAASAMLDFLRWHGKEAYIRVQGTLFSNSSWVLEPEDFCTAPTGEIVEILGEAASLIVFDCQPTANRLGFKPPAVPTVVFDHHKSDLDKHNPDKNCFVEDVPSTGCVLIKHGVVHPVLYAGLWADTVGFKFRSLEAIKFASLLHGLCDQSPQLLGSEEKLTEDLIAEYIQQMEPLYHEDFLYNFKNLKIFTWDFEDPALETDLKLVVGMISPNDSRIPKEALEVLCKTGDVVALVNQKSGYVSIRGNHSPIKVNEIAATFKGGGHEGAAGCSIAEGYVFHTVFADFAHVVANQVKKQLGGEDIQTWDSYIS